MWQSNQQLELAYKYVEYTGKNIFLTGKAGTGKTTFLQNLKIKTTKRMIVVAPTGVAAINAGGVTIHSFFQIPPGLESINLQQENKHFTRNKINIIKSIDLLVIDEISMVRADLLDAVDATLRQFRTKSKAFGGVQLLMIGDMQQLSPVVKDDEKEILKRYYDTPYFFSSNALNETEFICIELNFVFRQKDQKFIEILNKVRDDKIDNDALEFLNARYIPDFKPNEDDGYITLCTHNFQANKINEEKLEELKTKQHSFTANVKGEFPEYSYPTNFELILKENAQVMFVRNDVNSEKRYYNGKIGKIIKIEDEAIFIKCPTDENEIVVERCKWDNVKYSINDETNEIEETVEGSFIQFPLKLAWAITIHKSQGLTFERAIINAQESFAHGQVYVALSRCKSIEGLVLSRPIYNRSIINDYTIKLFSNHIEENQPNENQLLTAQLEYQKKLILELFDFSGFVKKLSFIEKFTKDNSGSFPNATIVLILSLLPDIQREIIIVAEKFNIQILKYLQQQPDIDKNSNLQERIKKAAEYFVEKIENNILKKIQKIDFDIDNKNVKKNIKEYFSNFEQLLTLKYNCLQKCENGFNVEIYLKTKSISEIEKNEDKKIVEQKPKEVANLNTTNNENIEHPELLNTLRSWRNKKSEELAVPAYMIFSNRVLYDFVHYLPLEKKTILKINGFGLKTYEKYGTDIIKIIFEYCEKNNIQNDIINTNLFLSSEKNEQKE